MILFSLYFAKWVYTCAFLFSTFQVLLKSIVNETSFFNELLKNVPAQILYVLGIIYGISIVLSKLSDLWKRNELNKITIKKEQERLEQEEITTEIHRKEIEK